MGPYNFYSQHCFSIIRLSVQEKISSYNIFQLSNGEILVKNFIINRSSKDYVLDAYNHIERAKSLGINSSRATRLLSFSQDSLERGDYTSSRLLALFAKKEIAKRISFNDRVKIKAAFFNIELNKWNQRVNDLESNGVNVAEQKKIIKRTLAMFNSGNWLEVDKSLKQLDAMLTPKIDSEPILTDIDVETLIEDTIDKTELTTQQRLEPVFTEVILPHVNEERELNYDPIINEVLLLESIIKQNPDWYNGNRIMFKETVANNWVELSRTELESKISLVQMALMNANVGLKSSFISRAEETMPTFMFINPLHDDIISQKERQLFDKQARVMIIKNELDISNKAYLTQLIASYFQVALKQDSKDGMMVAYIKECEQEELENNVMVLFSSEQEEIGDIRRKIMNCFNRRGIGVVFSELSSYPDPVFHALEEVMSIRKNKDVFIGILIGNDNYNAHIVNLLSDIAKLNN
jgi:hypothetical protein